jgi:predicted HTH domain antitoxin
MIANLCVCINIRKINMYELRMQLPPEINAEDAKLMLAIKLFETGKLSLGQSAKLAGYSKQAFMEILGKYNIPVFDYPAEDLQHEVEL